MEDQITNLRIAALETRLAAIEGRLAALEHVSMANPKRRRKELTPEERVAIRARLLAGQKAKQEREAAAAAEAKKANKQKGGKDGTSEATN